MPATARDSLQELGARAGALAFVLGRRLGTPAAQRALRALLIALLLAWSAVSLVGVLWSLLPVPRGDLPPVGELLNPPTALAAAGESQRAAVDIEQLAALQLFGAPDAAAEPVSETDAAMDTGGDRLAGIEVGARETRLALRLNGVISSADQGYGFAMIEHQSQQALYAVGDRLPVGRAVSLAKVLPGQVVIDNAGTYELLTLFEPGEALAAARASAARPASDDSRTAGVPPEARPVRSERAQSPDLASQYRERLYSNPQSLAEAVRVAAVREGGELLGYRVSPGTAGADFERLGFEPGDVVTAINGLPLSDPANTMRLYQTMRSATEAVFDIRRGGEQLSLSVQLPAAGEAR